MYLFNLRPARTLRHALNTAKRRGMSKKDRATLAFNILSSLGAASFRMRKAKGSQAVLREQRRKTNAAA